MIEIDGVSKQYGRLVALDDVTLHIGKGEVVGLLGPNGAGKTTLIRILTGYFEPSHGTVRVDGVDVMEDPAAAQNRIGYLPEQTPLYPEMLVQEYLGMVAEFRGLPVAARLDLIAEAVHAMGLVDQLTRPIGALSKGFRQRVGLAQAILHKPKVLVLDEPTSGLDPSQVVQVRRLIARLAEQTTVLFSTHVLSEVEQVCDRVVMLLGGRVCEDARLDELRRSNDVEVAFATTEPGVDRVATITDGKESVTAAAIAARLAELPGVRAVKRMDGTKGEGELRFSLHGDEPRALCRSIYRLAHAQSWELCALSPVVHDLEAVFRKLVAGDEPPQGAATRAKEVQP